MRCLSNSRENMIATSFKVKPVTTEGAIGLLLGQPSLVISQHIIVVPQLPRHILSPLELFLNFGFAEPRPLGVAPNTVEYYNSANILGSRRIKRKTSISLEQTIFRPVFSAFRSPKPCPCNGRAPRMKLTAGWPGRLIGGNPFSGNFF